MKELSTDAEKLTPASKVKSDSYYICQALCITAVIMIPLWVFVMRPALHIRDEFIVACDKAGGKSMINRSTMLCVREGLLIDPQTRKPL